jgi:peptide/nickel transport system substrate-binding protein
VILIDPLKEVYIDGQLETINTTNWFPRVMRKDYIVGLTGGGSGPDPDQNLQLLYGRGGELSYNGYCSAEVDVLIERQSAEADQEKRKRLVSEIEQKLAEDSARPIILYDRRATCWQPRVNGLTLMVNSLFNGWRMEDVWLDK